MYNQGVFGANLSTMLAILRSQGPDEPWRSNTSAGNTRGGSYPKGLDLPLLAALAIAAGFAVLAGSSVRHVNTLWDEGTDLGITSALVQHPLWGSGLDGTQARLPMYLTAGAFAIFGRSLMLARGIAILFGAGTIVTTFVIGRRWFGWTVGLLAALLLAISPYFIGFSRTALTEGDAFCALPVALLVLAFDSWQRHRDLLRLVLVAAMLGLALAAKFYLAILIPPLLACELMSRRWAPIRGGSSLPALRNEHLPGLLLWAWGSLAFEVAAMAAAQLHYVAASIMLWWLGGAALLAGGTYWLATRPGLRLVAGNRLLPWLVLLPLAAAACVAFFPEHAIQPDMARAMARRLLKPHDVETMVRVLDPLRLYTGVILLKLGWPLGLLSVAALVWGCIRVPRDARLRILVFCFGFCFLFLLSMPSRQTYYLMSVYPLLTLLLAAFIVRATRRLAARPRVQSAWVALAITCVAFLAWSDSRVYPTFGFYGYETLGTRWLGAESRGYRNIVQVTNDGTEDAFAWALENVPPGKRVVSYLWDDHVIDAYLAGRPVEFELVRRLPEVSPQHGPPIDDADYLLIGINNRVSYHDAPSAQEMERFATTPAYTVWRGRGRYRMPMVQIYERR
jgi:4-amino-4-deoxy-L-arabinose transferase-like glycosyltransferase